MNSRENALEFQHVDVGYRQKLVVGDVNLEIKPGQIVTLIGPNGSGKSTLLKTITGALTPIKGSVMLQNRELSQMSASEIAKSLSMVMTDRLSPELMTCWDVIATGRYPYTGRLGILSEEDKVRVNAAIALTHAEEVANESFLRISDGQRQRVLLARAIAQDTEVMVLDEPTSFLDMHYKLDLLKIIHRLAKEEGKAIFMSLHELDLAKAVSDVIVCVNENKIVKIGSSEEIYQGTFIQDLFGVEEDEFDPKSGLMKLNFES